jgi:hypothetical protein
LRSRRNGNVKGNDNDPLPTRVTLRYTCCASTQGERGEGEYGAHVNGHGHGTATVAAPAKAAIAAPRLPMARSLAPARQSMTATPKTISPQRDNKFAKQAPQCTLAYRNNPTFAGHCKPWQCRTVQQGQPGEPNRNTKLTTGHRRSTQCTSRTSKRVQHQAGRYAKRQVKGVPPRRMTEEMPSQEGEYRNIKKRKSS